MAQTQTVQKYRSDRFGFSFSYPSHFTVKENENGVELWTAEDDRLIRAGEYAQGTELPPHISIAVYHNPNTLPLTEWSQGESRDYLGILRRDYTHKEVSGRDAIAFSSEGLYLNHNIVLAHHNDSEIIVLCRAELQAEQRDEERERAYQQTFEQLLSTFQLE